MTGSTAIVVSVAPVCLVLLLGLASEARLLTPARIPPGARQPPGQCPGRVPGAATRRVPGPAPAWPFLRSFLRRVVPAVSRHEAGRRQRLPDQHVAEWCEALARRVRAGDSLSVAVRSADATPRLSRAIDPVVLALERGASTSAAVLHARHRSSGLDAAVTVIAACASVGGPAAEPLDRVAATLRARVAEQAERRSQSTQARLSALTLTVLPGAMLAMLAVTSGAVRTGLLSGPGTASVAVGAVVNLVGWRWMRRIIGSAP